MKFSDEELSRVLSAHASDELRRGGYYSDLSVPKCCVIQAAKTVDEYNKRIDGVSLIPRRWCSIMDWFDTNYSPCWSLDTFLSKLEKQGLA